jgi:hypothetical protein
LHNLKICAAAHHLKQWQPQLPHGVQSKGIGCPCPSWYWGRSNSNGTGALGQLQRRAMTDHFVAKGQRRQWGNRSNCNSNGALGKSNKSNRRQWQWGNRSDRTD